MTAPTDAYLPFIRTEQCKKFTAVFNYVRTMRKLALASSTAGVGKTFAALQYAASQPPLEVNGQSPVLYICLNDRDKTGRAFYNTIIDTIMHDSASNLLSSVAQARVKQLLKKYGYQALIIDEAGFLQDSGFEAVRTLWDETQLPMMLITMPDRVQKLKKYQQLFSRIARYYSFETLTVDQIRREVLPKVPANSHISFDPEQEDAEAIVKELHTSSKGNFRQMLNILEHTSHLISLSIRQRELKVHQTARKQRETVRHFDVQTIKQAIKLINGTDVAD